MKIRELRGSDKPEVDRIYNAYWSHNEYPNFFHGEFECPFAVSDDSDKIILAGGVRLLPEVVLVTDKGIPVRRRYEALLQALGASATIAADSRHKQLYAFVNNDEKYVKILKEHEFNLIHAKLLVLNLGD